jgi:hypothetical protein
VRFTVAQVETGLRPEHQIVDLATETASVVGSGIFDCAKAWWIVTALNEADVAGTLPPCFDVAGKPSTEPF